MSSSEELLRRIGAQLSYNESRFFLILSIFIGIFAGLAVVCFRITMDWAHLVLLGSSIAPSSVFRALLIPSLTGLVISLLLFTIFPAARGSGLNQTKAALYVSNGYIPFRTVIGKFITTTLAIGSGQSLGPEDPSLQIGAVWHLLSVDASNFRARSAGSWRLSALLRDWLRHLTRRFQRCCSSLKTSSAAGAPEFLEPLYWRQFPAW